jgi:hypothetical protein
VAQLLGSTATEFVYWIVVSCGDSDLQPGGPLFSSHDVTFRGIMRRIWNVQICAISLPIRPGNKFDAGRDPIPVTSTHASQCSSAVNLGLVTGHAMCLSWFWRTPSPFENHVSGVSSERSNIKSYPLDVHGSIARACQARCHVIGMVPMLYCDLRLHRISNANASLHLASDDFIY